MRGQQMGPHAILGLKPGASTEDVRRAWLGLVKELHPDGCAGEALANERLKAVNQAYQALKNPEPRPGRRRASGGVLPSARVVFAAFFLMPIAAGALVMAARTHVAPPDIALREGPPADGTKFTESEHWEWTAQQSRSYAIIGSQWSDEPSTGFAERLRLR
jgi:curved DNA-binding protein CbpA